MKESKGQKVAYWIIMSAVITIFGSLLVAASIFGVKLMIRAVLW